MTTSRAVVALGLALLGLVIGGVVTVASGARPTAPETVAAVAAPVDVDEVVTTDYAVEAAGDLVFAISGRVPLRVLASEAAGSRFPGMALLSVGPERPVVGGGVAVRAAFDVAGYAGDGLDEVAATPPDGTARAASAARRSGVRVEVWPAGDVAQPPQVFDRVLVPCAVETSDGGHRGTMRCPRLSDGGGTTTFSLELRWGTR